MTPTHPDTLLLPDAGGVAASRLAFLTKEPVAPGRVRLPIFESWRRSRDLNVAADEIELCYIRDPDVDTPLTRAAEPVLRGLYEQLDGQPVSIILTDPAGLVLSRLTGDGDLERHLDRVLLAPGFSYAEKFVGTNGIGTALEVGGPALVFGHEHYAENLEDLACAGVPIHDPISGRTVGAIDLTCWRKDAGSLLFTLAKSTAEQIRQALRDEAGAGQQELLQEYLRICHRMTGAVFAMNSDVVMLNDYARTTLDPADQAVLLERAAESLATGQWGTVAVDLPTGSSARLHCRPVGGGSQPGGVVVHVKLGEPVMPAVDRRGSARMQIPGLVGASPAWLRACHEVEQAVTGGEWLALLGEPGVGKLALLRAVHARRHPNTRLVVIDVAEAEAGSDWPADLARTLLEDRDHLVLRHVDRLDNRGLRTLTAAIDQARAAGDNGRPWVGVTYGHTGESQDLAQLLGLFPRTVEIPPLRLHLEDLHQLVPFFLARIVQGRRLDCSPEAMRLLMRSSWPGNVEQVHQMLREVVKHRRTGSIQPSDLPPQAWTVSRRLLTPLESMQRDAIVQSLLDLRGNKAEAARSLGMSRATIYRKIREYGVVVPSG